MFNTSSNYLSSLKKKTLYYNNIEQILIDNDSIFDIVHDKNWQTGSILGLNNEVKFKGKFDDEYKNLNFLHFYIGSEKTTAYFNFVEFVIYEE
ncbi:MAG: hypothetical protein ACOC1P_00495 [Minisyncoccales bacterium]